MEIPYIDSEFTVLFKPQKYGDYINDHCIVKFGSEYHLFGISSFSGKPADERYFIHAKGNSLGEPLTETGKSIDRGTLAWSPCIIRRDKNYYMFYGPSPTSLAVSPDMYEWFGYPVSIENEPVMAMHRDHFVFDAGNGEYLMYVSGIKDSRGCISVASSNDLLTWKFRGYALTSGENAKLSVAWGAMESPFVILRGGIYYLFITYTDSSADTYNDTLVFASSNPLDFGSFTDGAEPVAELKVHAPEIICENGKYFITTCGWKNRPNRNPGCVSVAELKWKNK